MISGKDAGKQGRVLRVDPKKNRLFVEGLNIVKRHQRPRSLKDTQRGGKVGGVIEKEGPIHISNVMVVDPGDDKPTRVRIERSRRRHAPARRRAVRHEAAGALMAARLKERYAEEIRPQLLERFGYSSVMQVPRLEKITLNMGVGEAKQDTQDAGGGHRADDRDRRAEARRAPRAQVDRRLQAA